MNRRAFIVTASALTLAACSSGEGMRLGPDGKPLPSVNRLSAAETNRITYS